MDASSCWPRYINGSSYGARSTLHRAARYSSTENVLPRYGAPCAILYSDIRSMKLFNRKVTTMWESQLGELIGNDQPQDLVADWAICYAAEIGDGSFLGVPFQLSSLLILPCHVLLFTTKHQTLSKSYGRTTFMESMRSCSASYANFFARRCSVSFSSASWAHIQSYSDSRANIYGIGHNHLVARSMGHHVGNW